MQNNNFLAYDMKAELVTRLYKMIAASDHLLSLVKCVKMLAFAFPWTRALRCLVFLIKTESNITIMAFCQQLPEVEENPFCRADCMDSCGGNPFGCDFAN